MTVDKSIQPVDTEAAILAAAEAEFIDKGFAGARTTAIAERAGVTHAMLHYYFRTKDKLFETILASKMKQMQRIIFGFIIDGDMPFMERISQGVRAHFEFVRRNASLPNFIINELRRDPERIGDLIRKNLGIFGDSEGVMEEVTVAMQRELDLQAEAGVCRKMAAIMLLLDIVSLNVFVFVGMPMMDIMFPAISKDIDAFLDRRCEENVEVILNRLKP